MQNDTLYLMIHAMDDKKKNRFIAYNLFLFFVCIYFLTASGPNFYNTDASQLRMEVARAIVERFDLNVPEDIGMRGYDGRYYSWVGIGSALLAIPFYLAGNFAGSPENAVSIVNQIVGAATVVLIFYFCISIGYSKKASFFVSIFYGLGTAAWPMAKQPFDHPVETFFILLSVYSTYRYLTTAGVSYLLISAFSFGFAFITRQTSVLVMLPIFIMAAAYYIKRHKLKEALRFLAKDTVLFALAFLPFIILIFWYNYYRFGSIFETGYSLIAARTGLDFFAGTSLLTGLKGFLISPGKGFFYYSPVAILFFFSIKSFIKKHAGLAICFICLMMSYLLFLSRNVYWHGDWAWGPRYLLAITPFMVIPIAGLFDSDKWLKNYFRRVIYFIFSVSLIVQVAAVSVDFQKYFITLRHYEKVEFTVAYGEGVQPIVVPPSDIYFDWGRSPIFTQFNFIYNIAVNLKNYTYFEPPKDAKLNKETSPHMNVFDFWWLYRYFIRGDYYGFIVAIILFACAMLAARRLWKLL
jgi:hypothetical protein